MSVVNLPAASCWREKVPAPPSCTNWNTKGEIDNLKKSSGARINSFHFISTDGKQLGIGGGEALVTRPDIHMQLSDQKN